MLLSYGFNKKIISGLCPVIKGDRDGRPKVIYLALKKVSNSNPKSEYKIIDVKELNGVIEVDATGTGCVMIHKSVLEKIDSPWFYNLAEDFYFYEKARKAGFSVYINCNCKVIHYTVVGI